ncbi:MAG: T9SS type A sorting domain-containing protein [Flavobacteriales bacterium]|nr:T9SS type A sorting domain-containing protein [Flavobacteriales bacterium]
MRHAWVVSLLSIPAFVSAQSWQQLPDFPGTARDDAASFSINGVIYVGTGLEVGWGLTNDWYAFDTQTETWSVIAGLPATPRQYCTTFIDGMAGKGYLFGGVDSNGALNELWEYDPLNDQWTQRMSLPAEPRFACVGWSNTGSSAQCYIVTGMLASGVPTNELWSYDPGADIWSQRISLPSVPRHRAMGAATGYSNQVFGGADQNFNGLRDVWSYFEPPFETWFLEYDSLAQPRYEAKVALGLDYLGTSAPFLIRGATNNNEFLDDVLLGQFGNSLIPTFSSGGRRGGVAGRDQFGQRIYFGTGLSEDLQRHNDWWSLNVGYLGIPEISSTSLSIFPNPANDLIQIITDPSFTGSRITIFDASGQLVAERSLPANGSLNIEALAAGSYVIRLRSSDRIRTGRFFKLP